MKFIFDDFRFAIIIVDRASSVADAFASVSVTFCINFAFAAAAAASLFA